MTVNTDWFPFEDQRWRTKQSETSTGVFVGKITVTTYIRAGADPYPLTCQ